MAVNNINTSRAWLNRSSGYEANKPLNDTKKLSKPVIDAFIKSSKGGLGIDVMKHLETLNENEQDILSPYDTQIGDLESKLSDTEFLKSLGLQKDTNGKIVLIPKESSPIYRPTNTTMTAADNLVKQLIGLSEESVKIDADGNNKIGESELNAFLERPEIKQLGVTKQFFTKFVDILGENDGIITNDELTKALNMIKTVHAMKELKDADDLEDAKKAYYTAKSFSPINVETFGSTMKTKLEENQSTRDYILNNFKNYSSGEIKDLKSDELQAEINSIESILGKDENDKDIKFDIDNNYHFGLLVRKLHNDRVDNSDYQKRPAYDDVIQSWTGVVGSPSIDQSSNVQQAEDNVALKELLEKLEINSQSIKDGFMAKKEEAEQLARAGDVAGAKAKLELLSTLITMTPEVKDEKLDDLKAIIDKADTFNKIEASYVKKGEDYLVTLNKLPDGFDIDHVKIGVMLEGKFVYIGGTEDADTGEVRFSFNEKGAPPYTIVSVVDGTQVNSEIAFTSTVKPAQGGIDLGNGFMQVGEQIQDAQGNPIDLKDETWFAPDSFKKLPEALQKQVLSNLQSKMGTLGNNGKVNSGYTDKYYEAASGLIRSMQSGPGITVNAYGAKYTFAQIQEKVTNYSQYRTVVYEVISQLQGKAPTVVNSAPVVRQTTSQVDPQIAKIDAFAGGQNGSISSEEFESIFTDSNFLANGLLKPEYATYLKTRIGANGNWTKSKANFEAYATANKDNQEIMAIVKQINPALANILISGLSNDNEALSVATGTRNNLALDPGGLTVSQDSVKLDFASTFGE